tara:strand:- start:18 stop:680 length:663 start_codon:yes stop_codon:yes gene_type:complete
MNVTQVYDLFRALIDETDQTFLTDAQAESYLAQGYREFRQTVYSVDPDIYNTHYTFTGTGKTFSLDGSLLGPGATNRMERFLRLGRIDSLAGNEIQGYLSACPNQEQLSRSQGAYCLSGRNIVFASGRTDFFRVEYVPASTVDWAKHGGAFNEYIDDLQDQHPLIALLAAQYYQIRDGAANPVLQNQLAQKRVDLVYYLTQGRNAAGAHYITPQSEFYAG